MKNLKIKFGLFSLLAVLATSVFLTSCEQEPIIFQDDNLQIQNNDKQLASVKFNRAVTTDYLSKFTDIMDVEFVEHTYKLGNETYSGFCNVLGKKESSEILNTLKKEFEIFVNDIDIHQKNEDVKGISDTKVEIPNNINFDDDKHYQIISVQVIGSDEALKKLNKFDEISHIVRNTDIDKDVTKKQSKSAGCWAPTDGYVYFNTSSAAGNRYVYSRFSWATNCLDDIEDDWTYEHDIWLNNYNNNAGIYLSETIKYASSSMPQDLYLDTNFMDDPSEVCFSIGTSRMKDLNTNTNYTTYIRTLNGSVNADKFKCQPQQGHRTPNWCHSTWCIWSEQSEQIIPAWNSNVPGLTFF